MTGRVSTVHPITHADGDPNQSTCRNCHSRVSHRFARVFGDNRDAVFACPNCTPASKLPGLTNGTTDSTPVSTE